MAEEASTMPDEKRRRALLKQARDCAEMDVEKKVNKDNQVSRKCHD